MLLYITVFLSLLGTGNASFVGETVEWSLDIEGTKRSARIHVPDKAITTQQASDGKSSHSVDNQLTGSPIVFAFHGHGGNAKNAQRTFKIESYWPEAIAVYMQGVPTPGRLTDPEGKKNGWQSQVGDHQDRDLKFFDAVLTKLRNEYVVNNSRVFSTGHSNGGGFTYLLWEARSKEFAAFAPSASAAGRRNRISVPKPVLHVAGKNDELVKYPWQEATIESIVRLNGCKSEASIHESVPTWKVYASDQQTPVFTYIHEGTHKFPNDGAEQIVRFFKSEPWKKPQQTDK